MCKKIVYLLISIFFATTFAFANTTVQQIQSPIYMDNLGRSHFMGRGGYSSVRSMQMGEAYSSAINEVSENTPKKQDLINESSNSIQTDITEVVNKRNDVPVSTKSKVTFTTEDRKMDPSATFGQGATYLPSGVNNSKTIYTDDIGRLHFFGKGNVIRE